ncbi:nucleotidyltransferase domain-containing protein [Candidatus Woesearchaeota archaeon]|nr:nucleotidyltransferase domain-containing protein [Candidatus Woesearchaeota archaeon]
MVQKSTKTVKLMNVELEIVLNLLRKGENHLRGIANDLGVSHTTVLRKAEALVKANALDYKKEGKNRVFSLKKTLKAKNYVYMAEGYKANKVLENYPELGVVMKDVLESTTSDLIVLFGSYAGFSAKADSDIDVFMETKDRSLKEKLKQISGKINLKIGKFDLSNSLIKEIIKNHAIIKGVEVFYEKTKFFE